MRGELAQETRQERPVSSLHVPLDFSQKGALSPTTDTPSVLRIPCACSPAGGQGAVDSGGSHF